MTRPLVQGIVCLSILILLSGCAHRLKGPVHGADAPPWIAEGLAHDVPGMTLHHRILLIGDAGYYLEGDPTLAALTRWADTSAASTVVFLGDNVYNNGLTDDDRAHGERILAQQLASTTARKIFLPGNHDWGLLPRKQNARAIRNQQAFVDGWPDGTAEFVPRDGCMGPVERVLHAATPDHAAIVFIALDPTPWINARLREDCPTPETREGVLAELDALLSKHRDDIVLLASHYPMRTGGPHGGLSYGLLGDLIVTPLGWLAGGLANTDEPEYADWIERTRSVMRRNPPEIYAAGHDHSLQLLDPGDVAGLHVVSGAGAEDRVSTVTHLPESLFAHAAPGFIVVDIGRRMDGPALVIRVIEAGHDRPVFEYEIPR